MTRSAVATAAIKLGGEGAKMDFSAAGEALMELATSLSPPPGRKLEMFR